MDPNTKVLAETIPGLPDGRGKGNYGSYHNAREGRTFTTGGKVFHIFIYEGYNAYGLIGTECNGLGMVCVTDRQVVFDNHCCRGMGFDYIDVKRAEQTRIIKMSEQELYAFLSTPVDRIGIRYNPLAPKQRTPALTQKVIREVVELLKHGELSYNAENKAFFHYNAKRILARLAKKMQLPKGSYDIRSNMGGVAVSGEVTLHGEHHYIQLSQSGSGICQMLVRSCRGRKDYSGGPNEWRPFDYLLDLDKLAYEVNRIAQLEAV
jgi:hypothetical protein